MEKNEQLVRKRSSSVLLGLPRLRVGDGLLLRMQIRQEIRWARIFAPASHGRNKREQLADVGDLPWNLKTLRNETITDPPWKLRPLPKCKRVLRSCGRNRALLTGRESMGSALSWPEWCWRENANAFGASHFR